MIGYTVGVKGASSTGLVVDAKGVGERSKASEVDILSELMSSKGKDVQVSYVCSKMVRE